MPIEIILPILGIFYAVAVLQALLMAFYLFFQKKGIAQSRFILALLLFDFVVFLTGTFLLLFFSRWRHIYYAHLANLVVFLAPPMLYFYYRSLIEPNFRLNSRSLVHFIPFAVIFSFMFYVIAFKVDRNFVFRPFGMVLIAALFIQSIFYLQRVFSEKKGAFTNGSAGKGKWFGYLFTGIFFIFCFKLLIFIIWNVMGYVDICIWLTGSFFIFSFIMVNMLVLYSLFNPEQLINYFKYQASSLDNGLKDKYYGELLTILEQKKLYLDPLLNLDKLARPLHITGKQLSQLINENAGNNFNDFINRYRITEAQNLMRSPDEQVNILEIAYKVGFNSKSTFNTAFKKFTNITPSEYRKGI